MERGAYRYWPAMGRSGIRGGRRYQLAGPGVTVPRIALVSLSNCSASRHTSQVGRCLHETRDGSGRMSSVAETQFSQRRYISKCSAARPHHALAGRQTSGMADFRP
jgi:hypothetical protein